MTHTLARLTTVGLAGALLTLGTTQVSGAADDAPQHTDAAPDTIVKVTSPPDSPITHGNLCIKGRFGFQHAQNR